MCGLPVAGEGLPGVLPVAGLKPPCGLGTHRDGDSSSLYKRRVAVQSPTCARGQPDSAEGNPGERWSCRRLAPEREWSAQGIEASLTAPPLDPYGVMSSATATDPWFPSASSVARFFYSLTPSQGTAALGRWPSLTNCSLEKPCDYGGMPRTDRPISSL